MKVSTLIARLQAFQEQHGDLKVMRLVKAGKSNKLEGTTGYITRGFHDPDGRYVAPGKNVLGSHNMRDLVANFEVPEGGRGRPMEVNEKNVARHYEFSGPYCVLEYAVGKDAE